MSGEHDPDGPAALVRDLRDVARRPSTYPAWLIRAMLTDAADMIARLDDERQSDD